MDKRAFTIVALGLGLMGLIDGARASGYDTNVRVLTAGETVQGELTVDDARWDEIGAYYDVLAYAGQAGEVITVAMQSQAFDTMLGIEGPNGAGLAANDDIADGNLNSAVELELPSDGTYRIHATSYGEGLGAYELSIVSSTGSSGPRRNGSDRDRRILDAGDRVVGRLDAADPTLDDDSHFETWSIEGRAGETWTVSMSSSELDAYLIVLDPERGALVAENDDFEGTDAQVTFTLENHGRYEIFANSYGPGELGEYVLSIARPADDDPNRSGADLRAGDRIVGELDGSDEVLQDNSYFEVWTLEGRAGESWTISMSSEEFDTYLLVIDPERNVLVAENDDHAGTDSQVTFTLEADGPVEILANSFGPDETGTYVLTVESARQNVVWRSGR